MSISTTLLDRTLEESLALTLEARNYIAFHEHADRRSFDLAQCLYVGYQHTRVSARLIHVLTWLLVMKAWMANELSIEDVMASQFSLRDDDACEDEQGGDDSELPRGLRDLLDRTHMLYQRIQRLDVMVRQRLTNTDAQNFAVCAIIQSNTFRGHGGAHLYAV